MNRTWVVVISALDLAGACLAQEVAQRPPPMDGLVEVAHLSQSVPVKPETWISPGKCFVLHGDLFADGRHLAVLDLNSETVMYQVEEAAWKEIGRWEIAPAWVPAKAKRGDFGSSHLQPPPEPFKLKDLSGDGVPELLISFNDDDKSLGYQALRRDGKDGAIRLIDEIRSEKVEPEWRTGYLVTFQFTGRKAWGSGETFFRWDGEKPVRVAAAWDDCQEPEKGFTLISRYTDGKLAEKFSIRGDDDGWMIASCDLEDTRNPANERAFVKIEVERIDPGTERNVEAEKAHIFHKLSGVSWKCRRPAGSRMSDAAIVSEFPKFVFEVTGETSSVTRFKGMPTP